MLIRLNLAVFEKARLEKGLSIREVAKMVGVSHVTVGFWRGGKVGATYDNARATARVLGVPPADLWSAPPWVVWAPSPPPPESAPPIPPITFPGWD
jgi:transcriptional regulator with XRE-family HTH domain